MHVAIASLTGEIRVESLDCCGTPEEGYVVCAKLRDARGHFATVCIDHLTGSPTQHRLFEGARHPRDAQAVMIELGAAEEGIVIPLLSTWLDHWEPWHGSPHDFVIKEAVQEAVLHLGDPPDSGVAPEEFSSEPLPDQRPL